MHIVKLASKHVPRDTSRDTWATNLTHKVGNSKQDGNQMEKVGD